MKGHIRPRGPGAWELKFDVQSDNGQRKTRYVTVRGGKREAQKKLTELLDQVNKGSFIDPSKTTLAEFLDRWEAWAATQVSAKTLERYKDLLAHHVWPHIGGRAIQKLRTVDFAELALRQTAIAEAGRRRPGAAHGRARPSPDAPHHGACGEMEHRRQQSGRRRRAAAGSAYRNRNPRPGSDQGSPRCAARPAAVSGRGYRPSNRHAAWRDRRAQVERYRPRRRQDQGRTVARRNESRAGFQGAKDQGGAPHGRHTALNHRRTPHPSPAAAGATSSARARRRRAGRSRVSAGGWRSLAARSPVVELGKGDSEHEAAEGHVSRAAAYACIAADRGRSRCVTVSRRIGHSNPTVTLNVYAHLFGNTDDRAAQAVETALASVLAG